MLMLELLMAGALAAAPAQPAAQPPAKAEAARVWRNTPVAVDRCRGGGLMQAAGKVAPPQAHRLGDLPKANAERAVLRRVDGCVKPDVVVYGVGK